MPYMSNIDVTRAIGGYKAKNRTQYDKFVRKKN